MHLFTPAQLAYLRLLFQDRLRVLGAWVSGDYVAGSLVAHDGVLWLSIGMPTSGEPGVDSNWVEFTTSDIGTSYTPPAGTTGDFLNYQTDAWKVLPNMEWDYSTSVGGGLCLNFSDAAPRSWDTNMPGITFIQSTTGLVAGLFLNVETDGGTGFQGGTSGGNRLDLGWGGKGGGNFELYSMNHATRPGQFRIVYGGGGPDDAAANPPYGHIQFTHYAGDDVWKVTAGLSKEGRFFCGLGETGYPGTADATALTGETDVPAHPFEVYNEAETPAGVAKVFAVDKSGALRGVESLAAAPDDLTAGTYRLWMSSDTHELMVTLADDGAPPTLTTLVVGVTLTADDGQVLAYNATEGAWRAADARGVPSGAVLPFACNSAPAGWLVCDGDSLSRGTYADLFDAIGTTYGDGDDPGNTFALPDLRGEFVRGWDGEGVDARGIDDGRVFGSFQDWATAPPKVNSDDAKQLKKDGTLFDISTDYPDTAVGFARTSDLADSIALTVSGSTPRDKNDNELDLSHVMGGDSETRPRNIALLYCIKL